MTTPLRSLSELLLSRPSELLLLEPSSPNPGGYQPKGTSRLLMTWWDETRREVLSDLRSSRWRPAVGWLLYICWLHFIITIPVVITSLSYSYYSTSACMPGGSFALFAAYDIWATSGFFQITLGFGSLSFTQAKAIDVIWDIVSERSAFTRQDR